MTELEPDQQPGIQNRRWVFFFVFLALQSLPIIIWIASLPGDPKNSLIFGLSLARFGLIAATALIGVLLLAAGFISGMKENTIQLLFQDRWCEGWTFFWLEGIAILVSLLAWGYLVFLRSGIDGGENPVYIRLLPFLMWLILLGLQFSIWLWGQNFGWHPDRLVRSRPVFLSSMVIGVIFLVTGLMMAITGWGIIPDIFFWGNPGVPLLAWQVWFALSAGLILLTLLVSFPSLRLNQRRLDWFIAIGLCLLAAVLWLQQPIPRSYFFPSPRSPTFQIFPYSDAGFYDYTAQSVNIGEGFLNGKIVTRPLYILLLAIWHGLEGQDYSEIILLQTLLLAVFPAALYWLGRSMRSREAGLAAGILAIFRELNTIAATPLTEVSHSKMLMTDSLTGLGICLLCLAAFRWMRKAEIRPVRAVLIGGFLGLLCLLRSQVTFIIPVVIVFLILQPKNGWKGVLKESGFFLIGVVLAVSPWIIRNGLRTGDFTLDQPSQAVILAQRYSSSVEEANSLTLAANSTEVNAHILEYTKTHPMDVARFVGAHFLNNELATLEVLPLRVSFTDYHDNFQISTLFWLDGVRNLSAWQWVLLILNLILLAIGIGSAWVKWSWSGLLPLAIHFSYSLSSAFGRISGWRFIQPVDWMGYFYFCLGFAELVVWLFAASDITLRPREKNTRELTSPLASRRWITAAASIILLAGLSLPAAEWIVPKRYTPAVEKMAVDKVRQLPEMKESIGSVDEFMKQPLAVEIIGRALYPRWYKAGGGEPGSGWAAYKAQKDAHLGFMMVGPSGEQQLILLQDQSPELFKHAADVLVYGCKKPDFIDVRLVVGYNNTDEFVYRSGNPSNQCE
jgi:hypothetical protein